MSVLPYVPIGSRGGNGGTGFTSVIPVTQETVAILNGPIDSSKLYRIDGVIDATSVTIKVPVGGMTLAGWGFNISKLITDEDDATIFINEGSVAGGVYLSKMSVGASGTNSQIFNLDNDANFGAFEARDVNFENSTSFGNISNYRQFFVDGGGFINYTNGFEFTGTMSTGVTVINSIALLAQANSTLFKSGPSLIINGNIRSNMTAQNVTNDDTAVIFDMAPSNFGPGALMNLDGFRSNDSAVGVIPNLPSSSVFANFVNCIGIRNTYPGINWLIDSQTVTTNPGVNTLVKIAGTTIPNDANWFTQTDDNEVTYLSDQTIEIDVRGQISLSGANNNEIELQIRQWDDSQSTYVDIGPAFRTTLNGGPSGARGENTAIEATTVIATGDRIELWGRNITSGSNWTALNDTQFIVSRKPN